MRGEWISPHRLGPLPRRIIEAIQSLNVSRDTVLLGLAAVVGLGGGLFSVVFFYMIEHAGEWIGAIGHTIERSSALVGMSAGGSWGIAVLAALGGLIVGPLTYFLAREAKGHGVPEVMEAVARRGGRIRPRVVIVKALASTITIGTGGSAGREGPIVQIGAAIGSTLGQWFHMSEARIRTLVACGAAAGIAATFNAPLAGSVFALEVILGEFTAGTFSMVVVAAAVADVVAWTFLGNHPAFTVPAYELVSGVELVFYAGLGLICAGVAWIYVRFLYRVEDLFDGWKDVPDWVKPAIGGLLFGLIAWWVPQSLGAGYFVIEDALHGRLVWTTLAALGILKIVTTALTLGSGGSGGVFAPGLFIGAMTGGAFGSLIHRALPAITAAPGAYAIVGMGAAFAGATQAPITGILILFEMTRDYRIIIPLMLACVISSIVANGLSKETIYTLKLARRGINLRSGKDLAVLGELPVENAMTPDVETVPASATVGELVEMMQETRHTGFPVVAEDRRLVGVVTLEDVRNTELEGRLDRRVEEIMSSDLLVVYPDESLAAVTLKFDQKDVGRLPVVSRTHPHPDRLVGFITRSDVLRAYNRALLQSHSASSTEAQPDEESRLGAGHSRRVSESASTSRT